MRFANKRKVLTSIRESFYSAHVHCMCLRTSKHVLPLQSSRYKLLVPAETRVIFPGNVENQRVSAICPGGDYTFMRNTVPINDSQPNVPSAMYSATADRQKVEAAYHDAICTVEVMNAKTYRDQFTYSCDADPTEVKRGASPACSAPLICFPVPSLYAVRLRTWLTAFCCSFCAWALSVLQRPRGVLQIPCRA
jgi:hypothetical protein